LEEIINKYNSQTMEKYSRYITRFGNRYTHPARNRETELGRLFSDIFRDSLRLDVMLLGSGSLRIPEIGPIVTLRELTQMFPYNDEIYRIKVTGKQFKDMIKYMLRPEALNYNHSEFYQFSRGMKVVVSLQENKITELTYDGEEIDDDKILSVGLQSFHFKNMEDIFGIFEDEVKKNAPCKVLATSSMDVLDENLSGKELVTCPDDERWIIFT